jgi:hypothetical protein
VLTPAGEILNSEAVVDTHDGVDAPLLMLTRSGNRGLPTFLARRVSWMTDLFAPAVKLTITALLGARAVSVRPVSARLKSGNGEAALDVPGKIINPNMKANKVFISVSAFLQSLLCQYRLFRHPEVPDSQGS